MNDSKCVGLLLGLVIGIVLVWLGPLQALIAALFGLLGWLIGKYMSGELPVIHALLERFISSRRGSGE